MEKVITNIDKDPTLEEVLFYFILNLKRLKKVYLILFGKDTKFERVLFYFDQHTTFEKLYLILINTQRL